MSKTLKIQSTKKGFKVAKVKTIANEHYIIVDESGNVFNKLKFVQVEKNLEVYTDLNCKEEKIAILENYYEADKNASVVGMDSANHEIGYILNEKDGWYYLGGELPETELGFAFPFVGVATVGAAGAGAVIASGNNDETIAVDVDALNKIRDAAQNNNADTTLSVDIYSTAGITGVTSDNIISVNSSLNTLLIDGLKADTKEEVQKIVDSYNKILAEANGTITDATPDSDPTADDYTNIGADISPVINNNESLKLLNDIIKTKEKVDVDTVPEIENLAKSAKDIIDVASGNKDGITPSTIINDLNKFGITANGSSIKNLDNTQQQKILDAIKATDDSGSEVDTKKKIQDIVNNALKDTTAPNAPIITSDEYTVDATPIITGTAEAGSEITLLVGDATYTTTTLSDGTWSVDTKNTTPTSGTLSPITQTGINIVVTATDSSDNQSPATLQLLKTVAPAIISGYEDNVGIIQSSNSTALITDDTIPTFNIGILPTSLKKIDLYVDGKVVLADYDSVKGTLTPRAPLKDGVHTFSYEYFLSAGKVVSNLFTLTIDTTSPIISIDEVSTDNIVNSIEKESGVIVSGKTDAEDGQNVTVVWGTSTKVVTVTNGIWNANFTKSEIPADGITTIVVNVTDKVGNSSQSSKIVEIDTKSPIIDPVNPIDPTLSAIVTAVEILVDINNDGFINSSEKGSQTLTDVKVSFSSKVLEGDVITYSINGGTEVKYSVTSTDVLNKYFTISNVTLPWENATLTVLAKVTADKAGNKVSNPIEVIDSVTVDTISPNNTPNPITSYEDNVGDITNVNSIANTTDDTNPGFNIGSLPSGVIDAVLYVDGVKVDSVYDSVKGTLTPVAALSEGAHLITYAYKDSAGNIGTLSTPAFNLSIDTKSPIIDPVNPIDPTLSAIVTAVEILVDINNDGFINSSEKGSQTLTDVKVSFSSKVLEGDVITYSINGGTEVKYSVTSTDVLNKYFTISNVTLPSENATLTVLAKVTADKAGNKVSNPIEVIDSVTVDTTASTLPVILDVIDDFKSLTGSVINGGYTNDLTPTIKIGLSVDIKAGDTIQLYDGTTTLGSSYTITSADISKGFAEITPTLSAGEYAINLSAKITDKAGNITSESSKYTINVDSTPPSGTMTVITLEQFKIAEFIPYESRSDNGSFAAKIIGFSDGSYVVINDYLVVQKFNADGTLSNKVTILDENPDVYNIQSTIVSFADGSYLVAYENHNTLDKTSSVFIQKFNHDGTINGNKIKIDGAGGPEITALSDGSFVVICGLTPNKHYYGYENGSDEVALGYYKYDSSGNLVNSGAIDNITEYRYFHNHECRVEKFNDDSYVIAYTKKDMTDPTQDSSVYIQKFNSNGTKNGAEMKLEGIGTNSNDYFSTIKTFSDGSYVVTYEGWNGVAYTDINDLHYSLFVEKFNADGTSSKVQIGTNIGQYFQSLNSETLEIFDDGSFIIGYVEKESTYGDDNVYLQKFHSDGTLDGARVKLQNPNGIYTFNEVPNIAKFSDGSYIVSFSGQDTDGNYSIYVQKFDKNGVAISDQVEIDPLGSRGSAALSKIVTFADGSYSIAYNNYDYNVDEMYTYVQKFNSDGTKVSITVKSTEIGTAYLVKSDVVVNNVEDILSFME